MIDTDKIMAVLGNIEKSRDKWCAKEVDDPEEMWSDIPPLLQSTIEQLREALGLPIFKIISAKYGAGDNLLDAINEIQVYEYTDSVILICSVNNYTFKVDPAPGVKKELRVEYRYGDHTETITCGEGEKLKYVYFKPKAQK